MVFSLAKPTPGEAHQAQGEAALLLEAVAAMVSAAAPKSIVRLGRAPVPCGAVVRTGPQAEPITPSDLHTFALAARES
jgi:hypothetical protein